MNHHSDPSPTQSAEALAARFPPEPREGLLPVLKILWAAFIATQGVFAGIYALAASDTEPQDPEAAATLLPVFLGMALIMAGASLFGVTFYGARAKLDYMVVTLFRFALAEAIGVFGLLLGFMGLEVYPYAFLGVAALLILVQVPSESSYQRHRKECLSSAR